MINMLVSRGNVQEYIWANYTLWLCHSLLLKMAIKIVDLPIENGDFP